MFMPKFTELSAVVHELSWSRAFLPYLSIVTIQKSSPGSRVRSNRETKNFSRKQYCCCYCEH